MAKIWDSWARAHRNARGLAVALAIWLALAALWIMRCQANKDPFQHREDLYFRLVDLQPETAGDAEPLAWRATLLLPDSSTVYLPIPRPAQGLHPMPAVGDRIPVWVEVYESGKRIYGFDQERWRTRGPR